MRKVSYVAKPRTVEDFGCKTDEELKTWVPEICGVCCLKMVGDTRDQTSTVTLWRLTQECVEERAFVLSPDGRIEGIFYKPLLRLANKYNLKGRIYRFLPLVLVRLQLHRGHIPILSIDLHRLDAKYEAGHLIVIIGYDKRTRNYIVHDPSSVLGKPGSYVQIRAKKLGRLSNRRGIVFQ